MEGPSIYVVPAPHPHPQMARLRALALKAFLHFVRSLQRNKILQASQGCGPAVLLGEKWIKPVMCHVFPWKEGMRWSNIQLCWKQTEHHHLVFLLKLGETICLVLDFSLNRHLGECIAVGLFTRVSSKKHNAVSVLIALHVVAQKALFCKFAHHKQQQVQDWALSFSTSLQRDGCFSSWFLKTASP